MFTQLEAKIARKVILKYLKIKFHLAQILNLFPKIEVFIFENPIFWAHLGV